MFQKYKYVLAVCRERSFTNAARALFISQPSLSVAIQNIEKQIGAPIFERNGAAVTPTEIGRAYIAAAEKIRCAEEEFGRQVLETNGLQIGKLVVGGSNYLSSDVLPQIISRCLLPAGPYPLPYLLFPLRIKIFHIVPPPSIPV